MSEIINVKSYKGVYSVLFHNLLSLGIDPLLEGEPHFLIDANVARLYKDELAPILKHPNLIIIEAIEDNKSLEQIIPVFKKLVANKVRRDHMLVAIGGGIIQDITCFIASTLLRGLRWRFVPTTLLAQADSCIGSKSSINLGDTKNILGTFNPPDQIFINTQFLDTLEKKDIHSGVGEIIKVHAIDGKKSFNNLAADFKALFADRKILLKYIREALLIKKRFIEQDEFDRGIRNIFNYGHSFGHAVESATRYAVPHGIAVTMGMDMANFISVKRGLMPAGEYERMHGILKENYHAFSKTEVSFDALLSALMKDKKNTSTMLGLIFPVGTDAAIERVQVKPDDLFKIQCRESLASISQ
ncbi:iron-containing alcohol dehydrogenase [bacterium]|nr:iron-containing alcohol dehydrogenase [bacterium]